jgi:hypothetical protein
VKHKVIVRPEEIEGWHRAWCVCGWRSPVYGGMDALIAGSTHVEERRGADAPPPWRPRREK